MKSIIILNSESRKTLALTRSFGRLGMKVINVSTDKRALSFYSKYSSAKQVITDYTEKSILNLIDKYNSEYLLACEEETMEIVSMSEKIKERTISFSPNAYAFEISSDKLKTINYAKQLDILTPKTIYVDSQDELMETISLISIDMYPLIIKPRKSSGSRGIVKVTNQKDLLETIYKVRSKYGMPLIQEFIPHGGDAIGVSFYYHEGKEIAHFIHKRLREFPTTGGPSSYCISIKNEEALKQSRKLLNSLNWNGLAMVEYKINPISNELVLMEVNPRVWGSIQLAISSGINFPKYMVTNEKDNSPYKIGYKLRWFFPADILSILQSNYSILKKIRELFVPKIFNITHMIFDYRDMLPSFVYTISILAQAFNKRTYESKIKRF